MTVELGALGTPGRNSPRHLDVQLKVHRNALLTPEGRLRLCLLIEDSWTAAAAAESFRISRKMAHKWWRRYQPARSLVGDRQSSEPERPDQISFRNSVFLALEPSGWAEASLTPPTR
jgi:hypothetical protein